MAKRASKKGRSIRRGRQQKQVDEFIGMLELGSTDKENLKEFLSKDLQTIRGARKSKRLIKLIKKGNFKKLSKFKRIEGLKKIKSPTVKTITRLLESDAEFYINNYDLINDYNDLTPKQRENRKNKVVIELEQEYSNFSFLKTKEENI